MIVRKILRTALAIAFAAAAPGVMAQAAEMSGGGTVTYVPVHTESTALPGGDTLVRAHVKGIMMADDPAATYHLASLDCTTTTVIAEDGAPATATGVCDGTDTKGNLWWISVRSGAAGSRWDFLGGTGIYDGIAGGGTAETLVHWPDGRYATRWQGKWTMK